MRYFCNIIFFFCVGLLVACSADEAGPEATGGDGQRVTVGLRIVPASDGTTRSWQDAANATGDEMMNLWTVVVVDAADDKVQAIHACKPAGTERPEVDDYVELTAGKTYRFYSFANMAPSVVMQLLGIDGSGATGSSVTRDNGTAVAERNPQKSGTDDIDAKADNTVYEIAFTSGATVSASAVAAKEVRVNGNGFNPTDANNGFGAKGIPMSNVQTKLIESTTTFDLIVVRMLAKVELQIKNTTGRDVTVSSITLTDVTRNDNGNLKLLPNFTTAGDADDMDVAHHGDLLPSLGGGAAQADYSRKALSLAIAKGETQTVSFYVNESSQPQLTAQNLFRRFFLKVKLSDETEQRYALIDDANATGYSGRWDYIARNDYRVIPVTLDDYRLDIIPYDFPPIGVLPCSVKEEDGLYTISFHDYGHFHLVPRVVKISDGSSVSYNDTGAAVYWTLNTDWTGSWLTYDTFGGTLQPTGNYDGFYQSPAIAPTDRDASENGGAPVFDATTMWNGMSPFIFGYIAEPATALTSDKKIYHELTVQLHKGGSTRVMLVRIYMILDQQQMLAAKQKGFRRSALHEH